MTKRSDRADRFVADADAVILHRAPGKPPIPGVKHQTTQPDASSPRRAIGLGTARRARGRTQVDVANRLGIGQNSVSELERRSDSQLSTIVAYLHALDATNVRIIADFDGEDRIELPVDGLERASAR